MPFNRLNHSILGKIRLRFALKISGDSQTAIDHVVKYMTSDTSVSGHLFFLRSQGEESHYWSPEMTVRIETEEYTESTTVSCLVGRDDQMLHLLSFLYHSLDQIWKVEQHERSQ
jgi:hypothetical protein